MRPEASSRWHFWVDDVTALGVDAWDPDAAPHEFASGIGHNLLELYTRLRDRGHPVSIGSRIPPDSTLVVLYHQAWDRTQELRPARAAAAYRTAVIRSDAPLWWRSLLTPDVLIVPNRQSVSLWADQLPTAVRHLPALPQRGLVARDPARGSRVSRVTFKGNPANLPSYLHDPVFREALRERGVELVMDVPEHTDGSDQRWHDFHDVDAVLCVRGAAPDDSLLNKPATRLINAWCAGAVPIVSPEPAYLELIDDGVDGFIARTPAEILEVIGRLTTQPDLAARVLANARDRGRAYDREALLDEWTDVFRAVEGPPRSPIDTARRLGLASVRQAYRTARAVVGSIRRGIRQSRGRG